MIDEQLEDASDQCVAIHVPYGLKYAVPHSRYAMKAARPSGGELYDEDQAKKSGMAQKPGPPRTPAALPRLPAQPGVEEREETQ